MTKKITISGSNLLSSLSNAWGGSNSGSSPITVHGTEIPVGAEWGMNRGEVERFIKAQLAILGTKIGCPYIPNAKQGDGFYHLWGFADSSSRDLYLSDSTTYASLLLCDISIPISTDVGTTYSARLLTNATPSNPVIAVSQDYEIALRYNSMMNENGVVTDYGAVGTISVQRSTDGGTTWTTVGTLTGILPQEQSATNYGTTVNIGQYFTDGNQMIRLRVSFTVTDDGGNTVAIPASAWITFTSVTYTELGLELATDYHTAIDNTAGNLTGLTLGYKLKGSVARTLHIKTTGSNGYVENTFNIGASEYTTFLSTWNGSVSAQPDTYGLLTHGVKTVEAWLTCSDGVTADAIESAHVVNNLMVDTGADTTPRLLLQNLATTMKNYVAGILCDYAIWSPSAENIEVTFRLSDYNDSTNYLKMIKTVVPGTSNSLPATVEIEDATNDTLYVYFHTESGGTALTTSQSITIDNTDKFTPTLGADFFLNPKTRDNSESSPQTIINAMTGQTVAATFQNFGGIADLWQDDDNGIRVLRIMAGSKLTISYDWLKAFENSRTANVTMEIDMKVKNVTDEDTAIFTALETVGASGDYIGLKMLPLGGFIHTRDDQSDVSHDFHWQEDERVHIAINIVSGLVVKGSNTLNVCRVFINGVVCREIVYSTNISDNPSWWYNGGSQIVIGQDAADIDIYGIRIYKKELNSRQIEQDYCATLPTSDEKLVFRAKNAILQNDVVNRTLCHQKGLNSWTFHSVDGTLPSHADPNKKSGWIEIHIFNSDGTENLDHSGTICKDTASLTSSRQGTTANHYADSNQQTKLKDVTKKFDSAMEGGGYSAETITIEEAASISTGIWVQVSKIHSDYTDYVESTVRPGYAFVCDGWIDGNGLYRGCQYKLADDTTYATKVVNKINYASAMQSHLMGACGLYNDLHIAIVGKNDLNARVAKKQLPFMCFVSDLQEGTTPTFCGMGTFGPGKMDDPTWGYKKSKHPLFCMMEGKDNNLPLTDFRVPFQRSRVAWVIEDGEVTGFSYNGQFSLELDRFKAADVIPGTYVGDAVWSSGEGSVEGPSADLVNYIERFVNFIYSHNVRIKYYDGTMAAFLADAEASADVSWQYWVTQGSDAYKLKRWDFVDGAWVDAGWDATNQTRTVVNLSTVYQSAYNSHQGDWAAMNAAFIAAIAADAKLNAATYMRVPSLQFHYAFTNTFLAGTDNCSKNTYYTLVPVTSGGTTTWLFEFHQDDMDTIFATNNSGYQTKPYYIDRQHPCADGTNISLYEGDANALFNLEEAMYEASGENRTMMGQIFTRMASLVSLTDDIPWITNEQKQTPWGCLWKYFFSTQKYFPVVAYNEQARLRYEYYKSIGFVGTGGEDPIAQSIGDQLQAELQYMKRRLVLFASYAEWGKDFSATSTGNLGLPDASAAFGFRAGTESAVTSMVFDTLVPHQYIYPTGFIGETTVALRQRCAPGVSVNFTISNEVTGDTSCGLKASNYYRSFGNIGDIRVNRTTALTITAKRLVTLQANPTTTDKWFSPVSLTLDTPLLENINLTGCSVTRGSLSLSNCVRLKTVNLSGCTGLTGVALPVSSQLTTATLPANLLTLTLNGQVSLTNFVLEGATQLESIDVDASKVGFSTITLAQQIYNANAPLNSVAWRNIAWTNTMADMLLWYVAKSSVNMTGSVAMLQASRDRHMTLAEIISLIDKFGNIRSTENDLYIDYPTLAIVKATVKGNKYIYTPGIWNGWTIGVNPTAGNNIAIVESGGVAHEAIQWSIVEAGHTSYATWTDAVKGVLNFIAIDPTSQIYTLRVTLTLIDGSTVTYEKSVGFFKRIPKVGDFAYADGQFDNEYDLTKTLVGAVVKRDEIKTDGVLTGYKLWVLTNKAGTAPKKTDGTFMFYATSLSDLDHSRMPWGAYAEEAASNGFPSADLSAIASEAGVSSITDTLMPDITVTGITKNGSVYYYIDDVYLDDSKDDGYAVFSGGSVNDFDTEGDNTIINNLAYNVVLNYICEEMSASVPTTMEELADLMYAFVSTRSSDTNAVRWYQLFFPAAYSCRFFEPKVEEGETLNEQYAKGQWMLPSAGLLARIYNFFHNSRGRVTDSIVSVNYANEADMLEARIPLFSNLLARAALVTEQTLPFEMPNTNYFYWSTTEYSPQFSWYILFSNGSFNGVSKYSTDIVARPVAAFNFML